MPRFSVYFSQLGEALAYQACWLRYKAGATLSFMQLKSLGARLARQGNNREYEKLVTFYDQQVDFSDVVGCSGFVGSDGFGQGTLNSFRVVSTFDGLVFEKIYKKESLDWLKASSFINFHRDEFCDADLFVPSLIKAKIGQGLVVANFSYVEVVRGALEEHERLWRHCIARLSKLIPHSQAPVEMTDIMLHKGFSRCLRKTKKFTNSFQISLDIYDGAMRRLECMPRFLAHGDLTVKNTSLPCAVFDWDNCGYFPPGFDLAMCMVELNMKLSKSEIDEMVRKFYPFYAGRCSWDDFRFCLFFLYFILSKTRDSDFKFHLLETFLEVK